MLPARTKTKGRKFHREVSPTSFEEGHDSLNKGVKLDDKETQRKLNVNAEIRS